MFDAELKERQSTPDPESAQHLYKVEVGSPCG